jgi:hypothetical protein
VLPAQSKAAKKVDQHFQHWLAQQMGQSTYDTWCASSNAEFLDVMHE